MTRAKDAIFAFAAENPDENSGISRLLKEAVTSEINPVGESGITPAGFYSQELKIFEFGEIADQKRTPDKKKDLVSLEYTVCQKPESLKLKLHGENYFIAGREDVISRINYGKLMHQVFEYIDTAEDIPAAVERLVLEGQIPGSDSESMIYRLNELISSPAAHDWFKSGNVVMKEADILMPSGSIKRPDRVILREGKAVIIDFKFGEESKNYAEQIIQYSNLLNGMGYSNVDGYIWYVDRNKITKV
jgi:ATP-dependent helicase/nuclease subunit A